MIRRIRAAAAGGGATDRAGTAAPARAVAADDLLRLAAQIERDRELGWNELQQRDLDIGRRCAAGGDRERLLCWLDAVGAAPADRAALTEQQVSLVAASIMFLLGFLSMAGFLFVNPQGVVNVLWFFAVFVLAQLLLCLLSLYGLAAVLVGGQPVSLGLNPGRLLLSRSLRWRELLAQFRDVAQLVFLRFSQGMGLGFVLGCICAFLVVLAFNDISFVWSSTFRVSGDSLLRLAELVAGPWSGWLPAATVDASVIEGSRYRPAAGPLGNSQLGARHGWWPFLLLSMVFYTLLPRLLLRWLSRRLYHRRLQAAFLGYPGTAVVLQRMSRPRVQTQAARDPGRAPAEPPPAPSEGTLLISWSDAIAADEVGRFAELRGLEAAPRVTAGLSFEQDRAALERAADPAVSLVLLVVKSWEPPMSDLADFVAELERVAPCVVFLRPLDGRDIPPERLEDWKQFSSELAGAAQLKSLNPVDPESFA